jgi:hypothetical protein
MAKTEEEALKFMEKQNKFPIGFIENANNLFEIMDLIKDEVKSNILSKTMEEYLEKEKPDIVLVHQIITFLTTNDFKYLLNKYKFKYIVVHVFLKTKNSLDLSDHQ